MEVRHDDRELARIELDARYCGRFDKARASAFRELMLYIRYADNERALMDHKGARFEKLKGKRQHQYALRLTGQWRLIVEFEERPGPNNNVAVIKGIVDYHGKKNQS